jgi:hypothetical protein
MKWEIKSKPNSTTARVLGNFEKCRIQPRREYSAILSERGQRAVNVCDLTPQILM